MSFSTVNDIVQQAIKISGQVSGESVATYTEPLALVALNRMFAHLWGKRRWEHLYEWRTSTLDGSTGLITSGFTDVLAASDIAEVRIAETGESIPYPSDTEHLYVTGSRPLYRTQLLWNHASYDTKFFKFWPIDATGDVEFLCGVRPAEFENNDTVVPMDFHLMSLGTAWFLLADDGLNPPSAEKAQLLFSTAYEDLVARLGAVPIGRGKGYRRGSTVLIQP